MDKHFSAHFLAAMEHTMGIEGGYSYDSLDPGGQTYMGISRHYHPWWPGWATIDACLRHGRPLADSKRILAPLVKRFYRDHFWRPLRGDDLAELAPEIASECFDTAVNLGTHRAVEYLQQALNLLNDNADLYPDLLEDGRIGPQTLKALRLYLITRPISRADKIKILLNVLNTLQGSHYIAQMRRYPERERFIGWFRRV